MKPESLKGDTQRITLLTGLCARLLEHGRLLEQGSISGSWETYRGAAEKVTPQEAMLLVDWIVSREPDLEKVKPAVSKLMNLLSAALEQYPTARQNAPYALKMAEENQRIRACLARLKEAAARVNRFGSNGTALLAAQLDALSVAHDHYVDKENILFSYIETYVKQHGCLKLMWSIHDDVRSSMKSLRALLGANEPPQLKELNTLIGRLMFDVGHMIFREEKVLFPAVRSLIPPEAWERMLREQELGYEGRIQSPGSGSAVLPTGTLTAGQLLQIFNNLPVDITLVSAEDKVVFFSTPEHRIFPRSPAVIGRDVRNCHPPESVNVVEQILESFRNRRRTRAEFRLYVKGRFISITYLALYTPEGAYDGVLEVTQDISGMKELEGEKRLLDWN
jgi:uncharacterized protein